jgi:hypothetical protein
MRVLFLIVGFVCFLVVYTWAVLYVANNSSTLLLFASLPEENTSSVVERTPAPEKTLSKWSKIEVSPLWDIALKERQITPSLASRIFSELLIPIFQGPRADFENTTAPTLSKAVCGQTRKHIPRVVDAIIFGFDLDMLEIRLFELYDVVDQFFITESVFAHSGINKTLIFGNNRKRFARFDSKIVYVPLRDDSIYVLGKNILGATQNFKSENAERNHLLKQITATHGSDDKNTIVISGDLDEIPSREAIHQAKHCEWPNGREVYCMTTIFYQYTTKFVFRSDWPARGYLYSLKFPQLAFLNTLRTKSHLMRQHTHPHGCLNILGAHLTYFNGFANLFGKALTATESAPTRNFAYVSKIVRAARNITEFHRELTTSHNAWWPEWVSRIRLTKDVYGDKAFLPWALQKNPIRYAQFFGDFYLGTT